MPIIIGSALKLLVMLLGPIMQRFAASEESKKMWLEFVASVQADSERLPEVRDAAKAQDADIAQRLKELEK